MDRERFNLVIVDDHHEWDDILNGIWAEYKDAAYIYIDHRISEAAQHLEASINQETIVIMDCRIGLSSEGLDFMRSERKKNKRLYFILTTSNLLSTIFQVHLEFLVNTDYLYLIKSNDLNAVDNKIAYIRER
jgi:hypothetical protein